MLYYVHVEQYVRNSFTKHCIGNRSFERKSQAHSVFSQCVFKQLQKEDAYIHIYVYILRVYICTLRLCMPGIIWKNTQEILIGLFVGKLSGIDGRLPFYCLCLCKL